MALKGLKQAEKFVARQQDAGNDVRWDGWDMVFFRGNPDQPDKTAHALFSPDGVYRHGVWGFENRVSVNADGVWEVDYRNVRRVKRSRN